MKVIFFMMILVIVSCGKKNQTGSTVSPLLSPLTTQEQVLELKLRDIGLELFFDYYDNSRGIVDGLNCAPSKYSNLERVQSLRNIIKTIRPYSTVFVSSAERPTYPLIKTLSLVARKLTRDPNSHLCNFATLFFNNH